MANFATHTQGTTKALRRCHETIRSTVKDYNEAREASGPMPITIVRPRRKSASSGSLLFDMDLSASWRSCAKLSPVDSALEDYLPQRMSNAVFRLIEQSLTLSTSLEKRVKQVYTLLKDSCQTSNGVDLELLYKKMESSGFHVKLVGLEKPKRTNSGSEFTAAVCCPYILVFGRTEVDGELLLQNSTSPCILDPCFKSQFEIQHPSRAYYYIMEQLPNVFVGSLGKLQELVRILCREMHRSFHEFGWPLPPWRVYSAVILNWTVPYKANLLQDDLLYDAVITCST